MTRDCKQRQKLTFLHMDDVGEVGQVSSVEVQQVGDGIQVLARLLGEILSDGLVGVAGVRDGFVQAGGVLLLVQLEGLAQQLEGLTHFLVLLLEAGHLLASELVDGGVHDHAVLVHPLGEGLEGFDLALHFLEVERDGRRAEGKIIKETLVQNYMTLFGNSLKTCVNLITQDMRADDCFVLVFVT